MKKQIAAFTLSVLLAASLAMPVSAQTGRAELADDDINYSTVTEGGYVYTAIRGTLERIALDTLKRETIVGRSRTYDLDTFSVQDGWLYWLGGNTVYKCKSDGSGLIGLGAGESAFRELSNLRVKGDFLYYLSDADQLYRMKLDGSARQKLNAGEVEQFELAGSFLYYEQDDADAVYRCDLDGGNSVSAGILYDDWEPVVYGDTLYYRAGQSWYCSTADGKLKQSGQPSRIPNEYQVRRVVTEKSGGGPTAEASAYGTKVTNVKTKKSFNLPDSREFSWMGSKQNFYFCQSTVDKGLYRVGWDGKGKVKLADADEPILFAGDYIVYRKGTDIGLVKA